MDKFGVIRPDVTPARDDDEQEMSHKKLANYTEKQLSDQAERHQRGQGINSRQEDDPRDR